MPISYNAGEVLEIAQQMERNGAGYYTQAAAAGGGQAAGMLRTLAAMERKHEQTFASMAAQLSDEERQDVPYDPYDEAQQYLRAVAGGYVFNLQADPAEWLEGGRTMVEVLKMAIGIEKDTIIFYLGLREAVPERLGRDRVTDIIKQEMGHVTILTTHLQMAEQAK